MRQSISRAPSADILGTHAPSPSPFAGSDPSGEAPAPSRPQDLSPAWHLWRVRHHPAHRAERCARVARGTCRYALVPEQLRAVSKTSACRRQDRRARFGRNDAALAPRPISSLVVGPGHGQQTRLAPYSARAAGAIWDLSCCRAPSSITPNPPEAKPLTGLNIRTLTDGARAAARAEMGAPYSSRADTSREMPSPPP